MSLTVGADPQTSTAARFRFTVPASDVSVRQWLEVQENLSISLRLAIKYLIEREGIVDLLNRPVTQLPRRGRPPAASLQPEPAGEEPEHDEADDIVEEPASETIRSTAPHPEPAPSAVDRGPIDINDLMASLR